MTNERSTIGTHVRRFDAFRTASLHHGRKRVQMTHYESSKEPPFFTTLECPMSCDKPGHFETEKQAIQQAVTRLATDLADAAWTYRRFKANMRDAKRRIVSKARLFQEAVSDLGDQKAFADSLTGLGGLCRRQREEKQP